jgi:hypothetical protein
MTLNRKLKMAMVGGGPGAFIGEVHRKASRMDGGIELVGGAFDIDPRKSPPRPRPPPPQTGAPPPPPPPSGRGPANWAAGHLILIHGSPAKWPKRFALTLNAVMAIIVK